MNSVSSQNHEILLNGSIITFSEEPVIFKFEDLNITVKFENDNNTSQSLVKTYLDHNGLTLIMTNCNNPLGIGNTEPLQIGIIKSRKLFFNYIVHSLGEQSKNKLLNYCWYLEKQLNSNEIPNTNGVPV